MVWAAIRVLDASCDDGNDDDRKVVYRPQMHTCSDARNCAVDITPGYATGTGGKTEAGNRKLVVWTSFDSCVLSCRVWL